MTQLKSILIRVQQFVSKFAGLVSIALIASCLLLVLVAWRSAVLDNFMPPAGWYESGEMHGPWRHYDVGESITDSIFALSFLGGCLALFSVLVKPNYRAVTCLAISIAIFWAAIPIRIWLCG